MAVFRNAPTCLSCGKTIAKAKYLDQSDLPITMRIIGDTFEGWEYENHDCKKNNIMRTNYINRENDEEIIDIMNSILSNGKMQVETINEAVLVKLMELRGTPIKYDKSFRNIDEDYERWKNGL